MGPSGVQGADVGLWLEAVSGSERAFAAIFDRHQTRVFRAAYRCTRDATDAEDVVAIVFLEAWLLRKNAHIIDSSLLPWLLTVTSNVLMNFLRSQRRYRRLLSKIPPTLPEEDHAPRSDARLDHRWCSQRLSDALAQLAPGDRIVVQLCLIEELPSAAAAAALSIPVGTVKSRLHRARGQLRSELADFGSALTTTAETQARPKLRAPDTDHKSSR